MQRSRRSNGPDRGNSTDRRRRKHYLLNTFGDGHTCECVHCGHTLDYTTIEADRIVPGSQGGSYRRDNIVPACRTCNASRQDTPLVDFHFRIGRASISAQYA